MPGIELNTSHGLFYSTHSTYETNCIVTWRGWTVTSIFWTRDQQRKMWYGEAGFDNMNASQFIKNDEFEGTQSIYMNIHLLCSNAISYEQISMYSKNPQYGNTRKEGNFK